MKNSDQCLKCGVKIVSDRCESYCPKCGLVVDDAPINFGQEFFESDPDQAAARSRTGAPTTWLEPFIGSTFNSWEVGRRKR